MPYTSQLVAMMDEADALTPEYVVAKLAAANDGMTEKKANKILRQMLEHGLVWLEGYIKVERGIPSFFTYFKDRQKRGPS